MTGSSFNSSTGELSLAFADATSIEAGKPYLVKVSANVENPVFENVTVSSTTIPTSTTALDFIPVLHATSVSTTANDKKEVLFMGASNTLYHPTELPSNIKGFRAYFKLKEQVAAQAKISSIRSFRIDFGDDQTTGIFSVENEQLPVEAIYTLDGRRINGQPTQKGLYIVNGKKVMIK